MPSAYNFVQPAKHLLSVFHVNIPYLPKPLKRQYHNCSRRQFFLIFFFYFSEKTSLDIPCEFSAWQMIHMKCQDLFFLKKKIII